MTPPKWANGTHPPVCLTHESRSPSRKGILKFEVKRRETQGSRMEVDRIVFAKKNMTKNKTGPQSIQVIYISGSYILENLYDFPRGLFK